MDGYLSKKLNVEEIHWHFSESTHGKGAPDRVGAVLKRTADGLVAHQVDIPDCDVLVPLLHQPCTGINNAYQKQEITKVINEYQDRFANSLWSSQKNVITK
ncbi:hypothetical protein PR048_021643 [Dryococelus australis]|uniref:Uncharacterized protein n=1 Tax=Dryococelus australis TaxID=614101 RepID=A0ABQ9GYS2_9NEOP|nr:hypothetical protein PR048_021643 [Dryococelus australis]